MSEIILTGLKTQKKQKLKTTIYITALFIK